MNPQIKKEEWSSAEEWILFLSHQLKGNKWAEMTSYLKGRTDNTIKNHWNSRMKRNIQEFWMKLIEIKNQNVKQTIFNGPYSEIEKILLDKLLSD